MSTFSIFVVLITIVCFLLVVVVMVQNPKGGGLSSSIGGPQLLGGVQKTTDFLDKSTWTLASILLGLILLSSLSFTNPDAAPAAIGTETAAPAQEAAPAATPAPAPAAETPAAPTTEAPAPATGEATK